MSFRSVVLVCLVAASLMCVGDASAQSSVAKEWTLAVFMNADNNLDPYGDMDIAEMARVGSNEHLNIVVLHDRLGVGFKGRTTLEYVEPGSVNVVEELEETDMGDYRSLVGFMKTVKERFPAEKYALVIWNHGAGWKLDDMPAYRGVSYDETSGSHITTEEMGNAAKEIAEIINQPIDMLVYDACLMQMAEVVYPTFSFARYIVASEESEPGKGAPYDDILNLWTPGISPEKISASWARAFAASYNNGSQGKDYATQSTIDCSKYFAFIQALDQFCRVVIDENSRYEILIARKNCLAFADRQNIDLLDFVAKVGEATTKQSLKDSCSKLIAAGKDMITANHNSSWAYDDAYGIAIYLPVTFMPEITYRYLSFTKETMWLKMMLAMFGGPTIESLPQALKNGNLDVLSELLSQTESLTPNACKMIMQSIRSEILSTGEISREVAAQAFDMIGNIDIH